MHATHIAHSAISKSFARASSRSEGKTIYDRRCICILCAKVAVRAKFERKTRAAERMAGNLQKNSNRARPVVVARARRAATVRATFSRRTTFVLRTTFFRLHTTSCPKACSGTVLAVDRIISAQ